MNPPKRNAVTVAQLRDLLPRPDGDKVPFPSAAAVPLGTNDQAAGAPPAEPAVNAALAEEIDRVSAPWAAGDDGNVEADDDTSAMPLLISLLLLAVVTAAVLGLIY